jgi:hypothetical protein
VPSPDIQLSFCSVVVYGFFVEVATRDKLDHSIFSEGLLDVDVEDLSNHWQVFDIVMHEGFESNRFDRLNQKLEGVLLFIASELDLAGEDGGHFFAAPGHESSIGNETNVLLEIRGGCLDD